MGRSNRPGVGQRIGERQYDIAYPHDRLQLQMSRKDDASPDADVQVVGPWRSIAGALRAVDLRRTQVG
jgi:hypothetical protein